MSRPRSVWVLFGPERPMEVRQNRPEGRLWVRYVLPPKRKARKARRGGNPGVTMANELLMRDPRFREMLGAKTRKGERSKR